MQYETQAVAQTTTLAVEQNRVLRNTYMMLALTMIPTIIGAFVGTSINFSFMAEHPIMSALLMFGVMMGLLFAVTALRNSVWGIVALLGFTFVAGVFLGPILQVALHLKNGAQRVGMAAGGRQCAVRICGCRSAPFSQTRRQRARRDSGEGAAR